MNLSKKILLNAGICLQMSTILFADAWTDAFEPYGGADAVFAQRGTLPTNQTQEIAASLNNTKEALAVGQFMSKGLEINLKKKFPGAASRDQLLKALDKELNPVRSVPVVQPVQVAPSAPVAQPSKSNGWSSWLSGSAAESAQPAQPALSAADLAKAVQAQQDADVAAAAASNQALASLVNSGATGLNLYKGYIDLIFNLLQQAMNAIVDPVVQQQVIVYAQNKLASMQASAAAANRYNSHHLGRLNSKRGGKKRS
jgi:hypothetical protein